LSSKKFDFIELTEPQQYSNVPLHGDSHELNSLSIRDLCQINSDFSSAWRNTCTWVHGSVRVREHADTFKCSTGKPSENQPKADERQNKSADCSESSPSPRIHLVPQPKPTQDQHISLF
jgi:hypothetical protein